MSLVSFECFVIESICRPVHFECWRLYRARVWLLDRNSKGKEVESVLDLIKCMINATSEQPCVQLHCYTESLLIIRSTKITQKGGSTTSRNSDKAQQQRSPAFYVFALQSNIQHSATTVTRHTDLAARLITMAWHQNTGIHDQASTPACPQWVRSKTDENRTQHKRQGPYHAIEAHSGETRQQRRHSSAACCFNPSTRA